MNPTLKITGWYYPHKVALPNLLSRCSLFLFTNGILQNDIIIKMIYFWFWRFRYICLFYFIYVSHSPDSGWYHPCLFTVLLDLVAAHILVIIIKMTLCFYLLDIYIIYYQGGITWIVTFGTILLVELVLSRYDNIGIQPYNNMNCWYNTILWIGIFCFGYITYHLLYYTWMYMFIYLHTWLWCTRGIYVAVISYLLLYYGYFPYNLTTTSTT